MFRRLVVALCVTLATGVFLTAEAHRRGHHRYYGGGGGGGDQLILLSEQDIDLSLDHYTIDISKAKGGYKGIRLRNKDAYLFDVTQAKVVYNDGSTWPEDRQIDMYRGERSRPINPTADSRFVEQVIITQQPGRGRGKLQVYGIQDGEGRSMDRASGGTSAGRIPAPSRGNDGRGPDAATSDLTVRPTDSAPTAAAPGTQIGDSGDVLFGAQYVGFGVDRDVIRVGNEVGKFDRIRLRVLENDIFISDLKVVYANGETDALVVNAEIPKNSRTNWIDLKGDRFIKEIQMVYRSKPSFRGQARIEVLGQYAAGWLSPGGEGSKYNQGWVLLGAQTAGFVGFDKDIIPVGRNEGGFKKLRVSVRDRAITLSEIRVVYSGGGDEKFDVRARVDAGGTYGPIDLIGDKKLAIDHIEAKYRSRIFSAGKGSAIVEIWGHH